MPAVQPDAADAGHPRGIRRQGWVHVQAHGRDHAGESPHATHRRVQRRRRRVRLFTHHQSRGARGEPDGRRQGALIRP